MKRMFDGQTRWSRIIVGRSSVGSFGFIPFPWIIRIRNIFFGTSTIFIRFSVRSSFTNRSIVSIIVIVIVAAGHIILHIFIILLWCTSHPRGPYLTQRSGNGVSPYFEIGLRHCSTWLVCFLERWRQVSLPWSMSGWVRIPRGRISLVGSVCVCARALFIAYY